MEGAPVTPRAAATPLSQSAALNTLDETRSVLQEATKVFTSTGDVELIRAVRARMAETELTHQQQQEESKRIIREWSVKAAKAEEAVRLAAASSATTQAIGQLDKEKFATAKQITNLEEDCGALEVSLRSLKDELAALQLRAQNVEADALKDVPSVRHMRDLYQNITNIRWDYDSDQVKGCTFRSALRARLLVAVSSWRHNWLENRPGALAVVLDKSRDDMLTFQLDPKKHSMLYITSHLWDLLQ